MCSLDQCLSPGVEKAENLLERNDIVLVEVVLDEIGKSIVFMVAFVRIDWRWPKEEVIRKESDRLLGRPAGVRRSIHYRISRHLSDDFVDWKLRLRALH